MPEQFLFNSFPRLFHRLRAALLGLLSLSLAVAGINTAQAASTRPNIILILADDVCYDNIGCYGSDFFSTPRIDALAASGVRFTQCFSEPLCTPSRVKIMTGREGIRNYVHFGVLPPSGFTFGSMLKSVGYTTAVAGKWQLQGAHGDGSLAPACGFDTYCLWNYPGAAGNSRYWHPDLVRDGLQVPTGDHVYGPKVCTDFLVDFIETNHAINHDQPFFVYYPALLGHGPFDLTPDSADRHSTDELSNYHDMIKYLDKCVGQIVDAVKATGQEENTVILFTTNNGTSRKIRYPYQGSARRGEKAWSKDGGYHARLIVSMPGTVPAGMTDESLVDFPDFMPALAEASGIALLESSFLSVGSGGGLGRLRSFHTDLCRDGGLNLPTVVLPTELLDGVSFWPRCLGLAGSPKSSIFQYYFADKDLFASKHGIGIMGREVTWANDSHYKLYRDGTLYDLSDREEVNPIAPGQGEPAAEAARKALQAALDRMPATAAKLDPTECGGKDD